MVSDLRYAFRHMRRNPGVTAVAVITLALGVGANTAMFSVVNAVLLRPLPYADADRLVSIRAQIPSRNIYDAFLEYNTYTDFWRPARSFESMASFTPGSISFAAGVDPERLAIERVNAGFLSVTGMRPLLGRDFLQAEDQPGGPRVAILGHAFWQRRFASDASILGRTIQLDRAPYSVIGVLPADFEPYGPNIDLYLPMAAPSARAPGMPTVGVMARLRPGIRIEAAQAEIDAACKRWVQQTRYPNDWGARVMTIRRFMIRDVRSSVIVLAVAVGLVLLIACVNVANLLLARAGARQREMAIRGAMGAGRSRLARQLLTESAALGVIASTLGLLAAWGGVRALSAASTKYLPFQKQIAIDGPVLAFTVAAGLLTTLLFGLAPAIAGAHAGLAGNLKEGERGGESRSSIKARAVLVVLEVALGLLLAIGSTLTVRSLARLQAVDAGFRAAGVLKATLSLRGDSYAKPEQRVNFFNALSEKVHAIPGVMASGLASHLPFGSSKSGAGVTVEGAPPARPGELPIAFVRAVDPNYLQAIGVRLWKGRFFDNRDLTGPPVAIINETMARKCWPNQDAVGKRYGVGRENIQWITVVGVIRDLRQSNLAEDPDLETYLPYREMPGNTMSIVVRTASSPMSAAPALRAAVRELDKELPLSEVGLLEENVDRSLRARRFSAALLAGFAGLALVLAAVGIYGVVSYSVTRRRHEIGIRMALGAEQVRIAGMIVGRAVALAGAGVVVGLAAALALTRLIRSMLFAVSATDPLVFSGASLFLLAVAAGSAYIPAMRAARVDASIALREE